ncbi:hypothetical protein LCGC14_0467200 [marine sediment metagenome]|uniref:Uncharacterized protein n=1 Tax=marine sediment metagenome TaxID=412755 RepID=A0A0F9SW66_9ZZZZ
MTFATLKTTTADWLNRSDLSSQVGDFINIAMRKIENSPKHNFKYMRSYATGTFVVDDYTLTYPTRYKAIQAFYVQDTSGKYQLIKKTSLGHALSVWPYITDYKGFPEMACDDDANSQFLIRPTIDQTYTYNLYYYAYSAELSSDSDTNWWTDNYWEVLMYRALVEASMFVKDVEEAKAWMVKFNEAFSDIIDVQIDNEWDGSPPERISDYVV